MHKIH
jgi:hypothetical protein